MSIDKILEELKANPPSIDPATEALVMSKVTEVTPSMPELSHEKLVEFIRQHLLAVDKLTEQQFSEALRQAIASGDFVRHVTQDDRQAVTYIPYREVEQLRKLYHELLYAVQSVHKGESRHETALRYIREAELSKAHEQTAKAKTQG